MIQRYAVLKESQRTCPTSESSFVSVPCSLVESNRIETKISRRKIAKARTFVSFPKGNILKIPNLSTSELYNSRILDFEKLLQATGSWINWKRLLSERSLSFLSRFTMNTEKESMNRRVPRQRNKKKKKKKEVENERNSVSLDIRGDLRLKRSRGNTFDHVTFPGSNLRVKENAKRAGSFPNSILGHRYRCVFGRFPGYTYWWRCLTFCMASVSNPTRFQADLATSFQRIYPERNLVICKLVEFHSSSCSKWNSSIFRDIRDFHMNFKLLDCD